MPHSVDSLGLEVLLCFDDVLGEVLAIVGNLSPHVVDHEGLSERVLVVRVGHRLEVESHHSSRFNVTELVATSRGVHVHVEEFGHGGSVFWEVGVVKTGLPLLVVVDNMVGLWSEQLAKPLVLENSVQNPDLIHRGLSALVSDAGSRGKGKETEMDFPDGRLREHHEAETGVGCESLGPGVVGSVETGADLVDVISTTHAPLDHVVAEEVVRVLESGRVAIGLLGLIVGSVNCGPRVEKYAVKTLGGLVAQVVVLRVGVLSESS